MSLSESPSLVQQLTQVLLGTVWDGDALAAAESLWLVDQIAKAEIVVSEAFQEMAEAEKPLDDDPPEPEPLPSNSTQEVMPSSPIAEAVLPSGNAEDEASIAEGEDEDTSLPSPAPPPVPPERKQTVGSGRDSIPVIIPSAPALRNALELSRALRVLKRSIASMHQQAIDEEATACRMIESRVANQAFYGPVMVPALERWLEVDVVVEESKSTFLWRNLIDEFRRLLEREGAFRNVRTWQLKALSGGAALSGAEDVALDEGIQRRWGLQAWGGQATQCNRPKSLVDRTGRRLILLVSDCVSPVWYGGEILPLLQAWGKQQPIALVQLLPENLWPRTALKVGMGVQVRRPQPGGDLEVVGTEWCDRAGGDGLGRNAVKLPVMALEPYLMKRWARMLAGVGNQAALGVVFDGEMMGREGLLVGAGSGDEEENGAERAALLVRRFFLMASPLAKRLVQLMAAAPVSLSVVYLIQETMLRESWQVHAAEVFMSGLIRAVPGSEPLEYEFVPGVRSELAKMVRVSESLLVLDRLSEYFASRAGLAVKGFQALLVMREFDGAVQQAELLPLLRVMPEVLSRLGKDYVDWAEQAANVLQTVSAATEAEAEIETGAEVEIEVEVEAEADWLAGLLDFEFEIAEYVEEIEPEIRTFEFEVLTFQRSQSSLFSKSQQQGWIQTRERRTAQGYIERLGRLQINGLQLEMMQIPGGSFMMGQTQAERSQLLCAMSSKDYRKYCACELPQHSVTVASFSMGRYPVTQAQWRFVAELEQIDRKLNPNPAKFQGNNRPIEQVSWHDAMEFCARLSHYTGREYSLPSEAQWEYACRAGTTTPFHFGEIIDPAVANYDGTYSYGQGQKGVYRRQTIPVGGFEIANAFGLYDMHGNVWEWCLDHWHENYKGAPDNDSVWLDPTATKNASRVLRGGSWLSFPYNCRCATRLKGYTTVRSHLFGFRVISRA